jgi:hypothetical protein
MNKYINIYGFLVKNLDLDSNLYNLKKRIKKAGLDECIDFFCYSSKVFRQG